MNMINVRLEYQGKQYVVGDFDDVLTGFEAADKTARKRGWKRYKKIFDEVDAEESIDL